MTNFMNANRFIDTNILLYAFDLDAPAKRAIAIRVVEEGWRGLGEAAVSVQVLQEMFVNLIRRERTPEEAGQIIRDFSLWPVVDNSLALLHRALDERARWRISFWDAMIVAAARESGARELVTEDLNHGQDLDGLLIVNPFR